MRIIRNWKKAAKVEGKKEVGGRKEERGEIKMKRKRK